MLTDHTALSCGVTKLESNEDKWLEVAHQGQIRRINFDQIIVAVGRAPRLKGFGLEALGITTDKVVQTNDYLATLFPNIYAAGDVAGAVSIYPMLPPIKLGMPV